MIPAATYLPHPNLVSALMDDRIREVAETRLAAEVRTTPNTPHRFRRFLTDSAQRRPRAVRLTAAPDGR
jgi:hypothetical protein